MVIANVITLLFVIKCSVINNYISAKIGKLIPEKA